MSEPEPSLIQQRITLDRKQWETWFTFATVLLALVIAFILRMTDTGWLWGIATVILTAGLVVAALRIRGVRSEIRAFEAEYGADAGKQD